jgi:hypothetical protein
VCVCVCVCVSLCVGVYAHVTCLYVYVCADVCVCVLTKCPQICRLLSLIVMSATLHKIKSMNRDRQTNFFNLQLDKNFIRRERWTEGL